LDQLSSKDRSPEVKCRPGDDQERDYLRPVSGSAAVHGVLIGLWS